MSRHTEPRRPVGVVIAFADGSFPARELRMRPIDGRWVGGRGGRRVCPTANPTRPVIGVMYNRYTEALAENCPVTRAQRAWPCQSSLKHTKTDPYSSDPDAVRNAFACKRSSAVLCMRSRLTSRKRKTMDRLTLAGGRVQAHVSAGWHGSGSQAWSLIPLQQCTMAVRQLHQAG